MVFSSKNGLASCWDVFDGNKKFLLSNLTTVAGGKNLFNRTRIDLAFFDEWVDELQPSE